MHVVIAHWTDKCRADMVSSKSLIISLCLLLAMAASYYWFIKLAWIDVINAVAHSFNGKKRETFIMSSPVPKKKKKSNALASGSVAHSVGLI